MKGPWRSRGPPAADARGVELRLDRMPLPPLRGDGARLGQLLDNLVSNAVKFTPAGGRVVVAVARRGDDALVAVSDTGIGVPAAEQRRLFDRFFRASSAHERAIDGTGLGLTIACASRRMTARSASRARRATARPSAFTCRSRGPSAVASPGAQAETVV